MTVKSRQRPGMRRPSGALEGLTKTFAQADGEGHSGSIRLRKLAYHPLRRRAPEDWSTPGRFAKLFITL
ncbi:hypothetical protein [Brevifollis gellanilyticus]|uniref:hypothetical protein n=1 Tax=Brevifollis gellanilyticus TaxID=748831 RepID=UPI0011BDDEB9|nr:hypothetical protein [Brevifollis gellanilyticus]